MSQWHGSDQLRRQLPTIMHKRLSAAIVIQNPSTKALLNVIITDIPDSTAAWAHLLHRQSASIASTVTNLSISPRNKMPSSYGRRDSLVYQASIERGQNEGIRRSNTIKRRKELSTAISKLDVLEKLNDSGLDILRSADDGSVLRLNVIFNCASDSTVMLSAILAKFHTSGIIVNHIETRPDKAHIGELEIFANILTKRSVLLTVLDHLKTDNIERIEISNVHDHPKSPDVEVCEDEGTEIWIPHHISDLDKCGHVVVKYEPTDDPKHPGYGDDAYIARRAELNAIARTYKHGDPLPQVEYTPAEQATWRTAYTALKELRKDFTCSEYQKNIEKMEAAGLITAERIPSIQALSDYIQRRTGFQLRPCGGLLSARDFLASLAFRVFQTTFYTRHPSKPHHCPEPDVIHEILGHCPMFADPEIAQVSQEIGLLSLGASDEQIERLATLYWFTVEFGLCEQDGKVKAIGAGLISAYGELKHACSDVPEHKPFDPAVTAVTTYEDSDYQPMYFVTKSIKDVMDKLKTYAASMSKSFVNVYDPYSQTVRQMPPERYALESLNRLKIEINHLSEVMEKSVVS
uniref:BH4_AAA_HYDROXYL_2 domain-containing protein n=1 Tax=Panagrellus redivivus TaxID=6233 RepID=A0A7E4W081_PANRE